MEDDEVGRDTHLQNEGNKKNIKIYGKSFPLLDLSVCVYLWDNCSRNIQLAVGIRREEK